MQLLPHPRFLKREAGFYRLPERAVLHLDAGLPVDVVLLPVAERLREGMRAVGVGLEVITGPPEHPRLAMRAIQSTAAPDKLDGYVLEIGAKGMLLQYREGGGGLFWMFGEVGGLRAGVATLRQLMRLYGRRLPRLSIGDYADFARRGV